MTHLKDILEEHPELDAEARARYDAKMVDEGLDSTLFDFLERAKALDIYTASESIYSRMRENAWKQYGDGGVNGNYIYGQGDADRARRIRDLHAAAVTVPDEYRDWYADSLGYLEDKQTMLSFRQQDCVRIDSMAEAIDVSLSAIADDHTGPAEARRQELSALRDEMRLFEQQELIGKAIPWHISCLNGCERLMGACHQRTADFSLSPEMDAAYRDPEMMADLALDLTERKNLDFESFENTMHSINQAPPQRQTEIYMELQACEPGLTAPYREAGDGTHHLSMLTPEQKQFAVTNFDDAFRPFFSDEEKEALHSDGKDIFDRIYVEGQSMNERYGSLFSGQDYAVRSEFMKCQLMADIVNGYSVQGARSVGDELEILPVDRFNLIHHGDPIEEKKGPAAGEIANRILAGEARLNARSQREKEETRYRIRQAEIRKPETVLPQLNDDALSVNFVPELAAAEQEKGLSSIYKLADSFRLIGASSDTLSDKQKAEKQNLVTLGASVFDKTVSELGLGRNYVQTLPDYAKFTFQEPANLFFIDGKPAVDYLKDHGYEADDQSFKAGIAAALTSGEHHVDAARLGQDSFGNDRVFISEVKPDLTVLDGKERFFQRTRAHKAEELYKEDPAARQEQVRTHLSEVLAAKAAAAINKAENPLNRYSEKFNNNREAITFEQYFSEEHRDLMKEASDGIPEMYRGNYGGLVRISQLYLMSKNPDVRYTDLMDPDKFPEEKRAAAREVYEALRDYPKDKAHKEWQSRMEKDPASAGPEPEKATFEKMGSVMAGAAKAMAGLNVRTELLHAMGQPEDLPADMMKEVMNQPENRALTSAFFSSFSRFGQSSFQVLGKPYKGLKGWQDYRTIDEKQPAVLQEAAKQMTPEERAAYQTSATALMHLYMQDTSVIKEFNKENPNPSIMLTNAYLADLTRSFVAEDGRLSHAPLADRDLVSSCGMTMRSDLQQSGLTVTPQMAERAVMTGEIPEDVAGFLRNETVKYGHSLITRQNSEMFDKQTDKTANDWYKLERTSGIHSFARIAARAGFARGLEMASTGKSFNEVLQSDDMTLQTIGQKAADFAVSHNLKEAEGPEKDKLIDDYSDVYMKWAEATMRITFPAVNTADKTAMAHNSYVFQAIGKNALDYSQTENDFRKQPQYMSHRDPLIEDVKNNAILVSQTLGDAFSNGMNTKATDTNQATGRYFIEKFGNAVSGKTVEELGSVYTGMHLLFFSERCKDILNKMGQEKLADYLQGSPLSEEVTDQLDAAFEETRTIAKNSREMMLNAEIKKKEKEGPAKAPEKPQPQASAPQEAEKAPQEAEKAPKEAEKAPKEAARVKIGFDALADTVPERESRRSTQRRTAENQKKKTGPDMGL